MTCNMGKTDRTLRGVIGAALITWGAVDNEVIAIIIGAVFTVTAIIGWCPPYALLGINSGCKTKPKAK